VGHYSYLSTLSVYSARPREVVSEESATWDCAPDAAGDAQTLGYGPLKSGSERAVEAAFPGRNLIVRPGVIAGPHDVGGRLSWWLSRLARGGRVIAPGDPGRPVRLTDARDLAAWILDSARRGITGKVNVPGPDGGTLGQLLDLCLAVTRADSMAPAELVWVPDGVLLAAGVEPYTELPLWVPDIPELAGTWRAAGDRARLAGLRYRALGDTVRDTWGWLCRDATARAETGQELAQRIGLAPVRERGILAGL
jgi:2'-hydroxyisoflavone reductase